MTKYSPLTSHLESQQANLVPMSFAEIEQQLGFALPASSRKHRAWWSNNPTNNVMTKAWLAAGYETAQVDLDDEKLIFVRDNAIEPTAPATPRRHPIFGCMKGTVTIPEGVDLTESAMPEWAEIAENARLPE